MVFIGLLILSRAVGNDVFFLQKDLAGAIVDGKTAKPEFRATDETATETGSESQGSYGLFAGEGPSLTSRNLQDAASKGAELKEDAEEAPGTTRALRLLPFVGGICCVCAIAGVGVKFFFRAGRAQAAS